MINSFKQKSGKVGVLLWGTLTKEPITKNTKNGVPMAWFFVKYGLEPKANPTDKAEWKTIKVCAYNSVTPLCSGLEKGEPVFICGELKESEYNGNREFFVNADIILAPNAQIAALAAYEGVQQLKAGGAVSGPSDGNGEEEHISNATFEDIDMSDIDDIFPGL